ncbi:hypothetical protein FQZ97_807180 [compost metagenome]
MQAHHAVAGRVHHQLHQRAFGAARERVFERLELAAEDGYRAELLARRLLAVAHRADARVREDRGGDELVAHVARRLAGGGAKQLVHHHHGLAQRHRCELHAVGHVAHREDGRHIGLVALVDDDLSLGALRHAHGLQTHVLHVGHAAGGVQHGIGHHQGPAFTFHAQAVVRFADVHHPGVEVQVHACLDHFGGHEVADLVVEAAQDLLAPVKLGDLRAQAVEDGGELAGNVATAHHHQPLWKRFEVEDLVGDDDVLASHEVRYVWRAAGGDQDVLCAELLVTG